MGLRETFASWLLGPALPAESVLLEGVLDRFETYDPDQSLTAAQQGSAYVRRLTQSERDLTPLLQDRMLDIAYGLYDRDAVAKRVLELTRDYILGEGVTVSSDDPNESAKTAQQDVLERFWHDPINQMDLRLFRWVLELGLTGEGIYLATVNPRDGSVRLGTVDPSRVEAVLADPHNAEILTDVVLKSRPGTDKERLKIIRIDADPRSPTYGRLIGVTTNEAGEVQDTYREHADGPEKPYLGACFYFRINAVSGARRGRSDLLCLADWIDAVDQLLMNEVDRSALMKNFIWDVEFTGATDQQIADYMARTGVPKPGSVRAHNEKVKWSAVTPDLRPVDAQAHLDMFLGHIATGAGIPKTWLSVTEDVNRATSATLSEPAFKKLASRQRYVRYLLTEIARFVLDQAELAGTLPRRSNKAGTTLPEPWHLAVALPEMVSSDVSPLAQALTTLSQGLAVAVEMKIIDQDVAQQLYVTVAGHLGVEIDLTALRDRLEKAETAAAEKAETDPYPADGTGFPTFDLPPVLTLPELNPLAVNAE